ncbi:LuxR family two component transcriptional regulator [Nitrosomonas oligotropha]|uniref:LuxR family two component transcriptional regulator n=1 Tax=Nitrosomonas oligotropha TaxID=42354 RepID=A0A2T5I1V6_9PROT|nr:response regulator transcription factor [Nitrosomonas oligotropha]PTQ77793.1 LuxR family two component transcriptional regulator [Nitrosomonas oligotropha]
MTDRLHYKVRVLVAENFDLIRIGLRALFKDHTSVHLVAETGDIANLFALVVEHRPDVALIDWQLSESVDAEHICKLTRMHPKTKVLAFSDCISEPINLLAFHSGASGIISKHHSSQVLLSAIHAIHAGKTWFNRDTAEPEQQQARPDPQAEIRCNDNIWAHPKFSNCERRIAFLATQGLSAKEISIRLDITEKTVRNQLSAIYRKTGVKKQIELCLIASQFDLFK